MFRSQRLHGVIALFFASIAVASAQNPAEWRVKPEWVRAHEMFLASDAMRGRGSATPDEWIAAAYVASEFEQYGIKPGLPDGTFIQKVELSQPTITAPATITAQGSAGVKLEEGKDFSLLYTRGASVSGPLQKIAADGAQPQFQSGSFVLLTGTSSANPGTLMRSAAMSGAKAFLRPDASLNAEALKKNLEQRRPISPKVIGVNEPAMGGNFSGVALTADAAKQLEQLPEGTTLSLDINTSDTPRSSYNAVGVLPGSDKSANAKVILLTAHLDHLGIGKPVNGDSLYNGANDDASGTTAVMELAHALAAGPAPQRTIYFVCYGSEELGGLGSTYFREHPPVPLDRIAANLEFEMIGNQDPKMPKGKLLLTGWDRSNLGPTLVQHGALLGDDPYPEQHFFQRSDNYPLALSGVVAHTAAGWGTPPTYHQPDDDMAHLDLQFMTEAIQSLIEPVRWLANSDFVPQWLPGKQPHAR